MSAPSTWRNRIVGHGEEDPEQLLANPANWRIHPKEQQDALAAALTDVGFIEAVIVNTVTQHVVDGHLRVALAISHREPKVPVSYVTLTEAEERLVLATKDPIGAMAATDKAQLTALTATLQLDNEALKNMLGSLTADAVRDVSFSVPADDLPVCESCGQKIKPKKNG